MRWAVRIIPIRKDLKGNEVKLQSLLDATENSGMKEMNDAIQAKNRAKFISAYKATIQSCYGCHIASDKPFLRLQLPDRPVEAVIQFSPAVSP